jgi:hypothetical protein
MIKPGVLISLVLFLICCRKENIGVVNEPKTEDMQPMGIYQGTEEMVAPNGKIIRVYNAAETMETQWGPLYAAVIYLYDKDQKELAKYNILELISENFFGGDIRITYNNKRNSFDMTFSRDAYGNYGTAFIDLNTNQFIRDSFEVITVEEDNYIEENGIFEYTSEINNEIMYVNSPAGLRVRKGPNSNGEVIYILEHRKEVRILQHEQTVVIDNIKGHWALIQNESITGWVFSGYLVPDKDFNIVTVDGKTFELINAGYCIIDRQHETDEIEIILCDKNYNVDYPMNEQKMKDYSIVVLSIPIDSFKTGEYKVFNEGTFVHSGADSVSGSTFKVLYYKINYGKGYIHINFQLNLYEGITRFNELLEFNYIGPIKKVSYNSFRGD